MLFTLYLIGYGNETPGPFLERLEAGAGEQVMVLDVRSRRRSWAWSYTGPQVEMLFKEAGHDYIWLPGLGGNGQLETDYLFGLQAAEVQIRKGVLPVVLLCAERLSTECHRARLAEALQVRFEAAGDQLEVRPI